MADQTVRISNLPDGGSPERVTFDLYREVRNLASKQASGSEAIAHQLQIYAACRGAVLFGDIDVSKIT